MGPSDRISKCRYTQHRFSNEHASARNDDLKFDGGRAKVLVGFTLVALILGLIVEIIEGLSERIPFTRGEAISTYAITQDLIGAVAFTIATAGSFIAMDYIGTILDLRVRYAFPVLLICLGAYFGVITGRIVIYMTEISSLSFLSVYLSSIWPQVALIAIPPASAVAIASLGGAFLGSSKIE